jgi:hypothetical protein
MSALKNSGSRLVGEKTASLYPSSQNYVSSRGVPSAARQQPENLIRRAADEIFGLVSLEVNR